jgi:hypothetical protein
MEGITFERQCRTPQSEGYYLTRGEDRIGRVDLHFGATIVYGTLIVEVELSDDDVNDLIEQVDEQLVLTADVERDDFQVTVYQGKELGFYSDDYYDDEDEDEDEEAPKADKGEE